MCWTFAAASRSAITQDGKGTVSFGIAEFIAQEEMNRDTGYWWSPDDTRIAYTRVDEARIPETERFEINARSVVVVRQRYPFTGAANVPVQLFVASVAEPGKAVRMDLGADDDIYLARVEFFPGSDALAVQRQSRDQKRLELLRMDAATGAASVLLTETSDTWVALHDELTFLPEAQAVRLGLQSQRLPAAVPLRLQRQGIAPADDGKQQYGRRARRGGDSRRG